MVELGAGEEIAAALRARGWCRCLDALPPPLLTALRADLLQRRDQFVPAGVGRAAANRRAAAIRADTTLWLDGDSPAQREFLAAMDTLRIRLNRSLLLGLQDYEGHYAHYRPGAGYRRHLDAFRGAGDGAPRRVLSVVFYLNLDWDERDGGELVLWDESGDELLRAAPADGSALLFLSAEFPHEVLPPRVDRYSIAGWFRDGGGAGA